MHLLHKWSKWEQYEYKWQEVNGKKPMSVRCVEKRQKRKCKKCGKEQDRLVSFT